MRFRQGSLQNDIELLSVTLFWAFNLVVLKFGLKEIDPLAYNICRFTCASIVLLVLAWTMESSLSVRRQDIGRLVLLAFVGHTGFQICFIEGVANTTASSVALIFGSGPVIVGVMSWIAGHERIHLAGALGVLLGFFGVYIIVSAGARNPAADAVNPMLGNLLIVAAVVCWSAYTVLARDLLLRYSPLRITALTLPIGLGFLIPPSLPEFLRQDWPAVSGLTWAGLIYSFMFPLVIAYVFWYRSVKKVGNLRTAVYSNLVPVFGTLFAVLFLDERFTPGLGLGAAFILSGIIFTRVGQRRR